MAYNLTGLLTEFYARGFSSLNDSGTGTTRATQWINDGYQAVCELDSWPFLETTITGPAPLTISDLREILYVVDTTQGFRLVQGDARDVVDLDPAVTTSGIPTMYWLDGLTTLKVWQANTGDSLSVRYIKTPTDLSSGTDVPVVPGRYRNLIVDFAVMQALKDKSNFDEAKALLASVQPDIQRMRDALLDRAGDDPDFVVVTQAYESGWWGWR